MNFSRPAISGQCLAITAVVVLAGFVYAESVFTIPDSNFGGQLHFGSRNTGWSQNPSTVEIAKTGRDQNGAYFMLFDLPEQPLGGFRDKDTSLVLTHKTNSVTQTTIHIDVWAIGYVRPAELPLDFTRVNAFQLYADTEDKDGWNLGSNNTVKISNDVIGHDAVPDQKISLPPAACTDLTDFANDLFDHHGAVAGDYLMLRLNADANPGNSWTVYGPASDVSVKPVLTLSGPAPGTVITLQ